MSPSAPKAGESGEAAKKNAYLVYEITREETCELVGCFDDKAERKEAEEDLPPVKWSATVVGCFFAETAAQACQLAAESEKRLANYIAVDAVFPKVAFAQERREDKELERLNRRRRLKSVRNFC